MALPNNIVDLSPTDFCGKQVMSFAEAFWTKTFEHPQLSEILTVISGVKAKQQVIILGTGLLLGKTMQTGNCAPDVSDQEITAIQKFYDPAGIEDRFTECWKNLLPKFAVWGLKNGIQKPDLTGTDFADFLEAEVVAGLIESVFRIVWFAEKTAANYTGGGHFTDGLNLRYVNAINGLWNQFYAIVAAKPAQRVTIAKNAGATFALQAFTAQDTIDQVVTGYFQYMVNNMDERLAGDAGVKFYVTRSIANQYMAERRAFTNIDQAYQRTESGFDQLRFGGYDVVVLHFEDRMIKQFQSSATVSYQPHRIYFVNKDNLHLATEEETALSGFKAWYRDYDNQYYIDMLYNIDALVIEDYKVMVAY
jgi:hypothetical protein